MPAHLNVPLVKVYSLSVVIRFVNLTMCLEHSKAEDQRAVLQGIIALDSRRILVRLRSHHETSQGRNKSKPALIPQLSDALRMYAPTSLRFKSESLMRLHNQLEGFQAVNIAEMHHQNILMDIVQQASELTSGDQFTTVLGSLSKLDPTTRRHLSLAFGKVGRYYTASQFLVSAARKMRKLFRRIDVEIVPLEFFPTDNDALVANNLSHCKIHAEIQLLLFYESHPEYPQPRVICSNKCACYLCDLFFRIHGRFHIPSTHGKLYPKWTLPDWTDIVPSTRLQELSRIVDQVNLTLRRKIADARAGRRRIVNHPNESQLFQQLQWSLSTVLLNQPQGSEVSFPISENEGSSRLIAPSHTVEPTHIAESSHIVGLSHQGLNCATDCIMPDIPQQQETTSISKAGSNCTIHTSPSPESYSPASALTTASSLVSQSGDGSTRNIPSFRPDLGSRLGIDIAVPPVEHEAAYFNLDLTRGEAVWKHLGVDGAMRISTTSIDATFSHQECSNGSEKCLLDCWAHVRWLLPADEMDVDIRSVSLKNLSTATDFSLSPKQTSLYMMHKRDIVLLEFSHDGPVEE